MERDELLRKPIAYSMFSVTGFLFFFFCLTGRDLARAGNILWTGGYLCRTLLCSLFFGAVAGSVLCACMYRLAAKRRKAGCPGAGREGGGRTVPWRRDGRVVSQAKRRKAGSTAEARKAGCPGAAVYVGSFFLIAAAWLPGYLAYYPAICAYDSPVQVGQIAEHSFIDHHPLAHTLLIKGAMDFGSNVLGSVNGGIAAYALLQLLFLASVLAFGILRLYQRGVRRLWLILLLCLFMGFPFNLYLSVSVTKDTVFSAFFVLQLIAVYELLCEEERGKRVSWKELLFLFSTIGMILFRNNGKYAFLVFLAALILVYLLCREDRIRFKRLLLWSVSGFLAGNIILAMLFRLTDAEQGDKREMLSMPIQQLARCMLYHGGAGVLPEDDHTMDEEDRSLIQDFILEEGYREYNPVISDPVKRHTNTYVVRYRPKDFISTYFRLLCRYPGDFVNAALAVDAGYLYPNDVTHAYVNTSEGVSGMGYVQTRWNEEVFANYGIYKDSRWKWLHEHMERWADENGYLRIPVFRYLFMPGIWVWLYLLLFDRLMFRRKFVRCLPLALVLGYYGTLLLGPAVQLRYIYPVMLAFPFAALMDIPDTGRR